MKHPSQLALALSLAVAACHAEADRADATAQPALSPSTAPVVDAAAGPVKSTTAATLDSATPLAVGSTAPDFTVEAWLADNEPSEQVRRAVTERLDEAKRALRAQARSRAEG